MEVESVVFVPKNKHGGYNCRVEIIRAGRKDDPDGCMVFLRPSLGKCGSQGDEHHLQLLIGEVNCVTRNYPFWIGNVKFVASLVPEYEIQLVRYDGKILGFDEAVKFFEGFSAIKKE